jgi:hypothetical protein
VKEGAWLRADTGDWRWIDEHADWIRRIPCALMAGLGEEAARRIAAMPRTRANGPEREAILLAAMAQGLIRFRGHGAEVTFETTLPLAEAVHAVRRFMAEQFGAYNLVRIHRLPQGPCIAVPYHELERALAEGSLEQLLQRAERE